MHTISSYQPKDKQVLIELLRLNTPKYFAASEEKDFANYLDNDADNYFVVREKDTIVGAGGINFSADSKTAFIAWDVFHPNAQGKGLGGSLVKFRLDKIKQLSKIEGIVVRTSQLTYGFYAKFGFELKEIVTDYWAPGFDLYKMELTV